MKGKAIGGADSTNRFYARTSNTNFSRFLPS